VYILCLSAKTRTGKGVSHLTMILSLRTDVVAEHSIIREELGIRDQSDRHVRCRRNALSVALHKQIGNHHGDTYLTNAANSFDIEC